MTETPEPIAVPEEAEPPSTVLFVHDLRDQIVCVGCYQGKELEQMELVPDEDGMYFDLCVACAARRRGDEPAAAPVGYNADMVDTTGEGQE